MSRVCPLRPRMYTFPVHKPASGGFCDFFHSDEDPLLLELCECVPQYVARRARRLQGPRVYGSLLVMYKVPHGSRCVVDRTRSSGRGAESETD